MDLSRSAVDRRDRVSRWPVAAPGRRRQRGRRATASTRPRARSRSACCARGSGAPDAAWLRATARRARSPRAQRSPSTDRAAPVHGESDGIPAVVADRFGDTIVVASYARRRRRARALRRALLRARRRPRSSRPRAPSWRARARRRAPTRSPRARSAARRREVATFRRGRRSTIAVDLAAGHKTGAYLDLRGLRRAVAAAPLAGARVLNLFAYTGMLGRAAEAAGAARDRRRSIASERALAFAAAHHVGRSARAPPLRHGRRRSSWLPALDPARDVRPRDRRPAGDDEPDRRRSPRVLAAYRKLYRAAAAHVRPGGALVAACCTSRVERAAFRRDRRPRARRRASRSSASSPPELDHPVGFPQADYLKIRLVAPRAA